MATYDIDTLKIGDTSISVTDGSVTTLSVGGTDIDITTVNSLVVGDDTLQWDIDTRIRSASYLVQLTSDLLIYPMLADGTVSDTPVTHGTEGQYAVLIEPKGTYSVGDTINFDKEEEYNELFAMSGGSFALKQRTVFTGTVVEGGIEDIQVWSDSEHLNETLAGDYEIYATIRNNIVFVYDYSDLYNFDTTKIWRFGLYATSLFRGFGIVGCEFDSDDHVYQDVLVRFAFVDRANSSMAYACDLCTNLKSPLVVLTTAVACRNIDYIFRQCTSLAPSSYVGDYEYMASYVKVKYARGAFSYTNAPPYVGCWPLLESAYNMYQGAQIDNSVIYDKWYASECGLPDNPMPNLTNMRGMFANCTPASGDTVSIYAKVDLYNPDTDYVENGLEGVFDGFSGLVCAVSNEDSTVRYTYDSDKVTGDYAVLGTESTFGYLTPVVDDTEDSTT